jgi:release factor glutamine methyltransferase
MTEKELLLTSILNCSRSSLYNGDFSLKPKELKKLSRCLSLRSEGFPLQYILGEVEFFGLILKVDKRVFIPRPETEILVERAIAILQSSGLEVQRILDIGTGSGCIAISLSKFVKNAEVTAIDISNPALEIAKQNASLNNVKVNFLTSDLFSNCELPTANYELIISNPPYVRSQDIKHLQKELRYEPRIALDGGCGGLDFYRRIIQDAPVFLKKDGLLLMEIGFGQCNKIKNLLQMSHNFEIIDIVKDYSGIERVIAARLIKSNLSACLLSRQEAMVDG